MESKVIPTYEYLVCTYYYEYPEVIRQRYVSNKRGPGVIPNRDPGVSIWPEADPFSRVFTFLLI